MNSKLITRSIIVALAGFLFGFDTVVISGADKALQNLWGFSAFMHGNVIMASALWGTVIGAVFGNIPTNRLGRRKTLIIIGVLYTVSAIGSAIANDPWFFAFARFIGGLGVGASTIAAPAYITEISPARDRGKLVALYQFNIVFGILAAFISNYLCGKYIQVDAWRWMMGVEALPALIYTFMSLTIPESPRYLLVQKNDETGARAVLNNLISEEETNQVISEMKEEISSIKTSDSIFDKKYRFSLWIAFFIAFFNQFSGINAFLYYAPRIFEAAGLSQDSALLSGVGVGIVNFLFTLVGMMYIDKFGRKQLLYIGCIGMIIALSAVSYAFATGVTGMSIPFFFFMFIASFAVSSGAVIWVVISEVFPTFLRADGQAWGCGTHWVLAALIPAFIPFLIDAIGVSTVFGFFAFMMLLQLLYVYKVLPETKGLSVEELQKVLNR